MGDNDSIGPNSTNTNSEFNRNPFYIYCGIAILFIIVGTLLNLWFLVAILCSPDMRSRLRNKIICNSLVLQLVDSAIIFPMVVRAVLNERAFNCILYSTMDHLQLIQDFIGNWLLVMLLAVFIAQIEDFNPKMKLTPRTVTLGTVGLLVFPWIASLVLVPVIVHEYHKRLSYRGNCVFATLDALEVFKCVDTAVPILLCVLLLIIALFLRYRRFTRGYPSGSMQTELISRGPEIDSSMAYIVGTAICIFCDLFKMIVFFNYLTFANYSFKIWINIFIASITMSDSRVILMPLTWLLLPDVRQRIRTWRPWYRPASVIDLTMTYRKEEN